jgi:hypothetical protein
MITIKGSVAGIMLLGFFFTAGICLADSPIPNLLGTWTVKSRAILMLKGSAPGNWTHHTQQVNELTAEAVFKKQDGRLLWGHFTSPRMSEDFIAVIGLDNKTLYLVDQDGFTDAALVDKDTIQSIYRHTGPADSVISQGIWRRNK